MTSADLDPSPRRPPDAVPPLRLAAVRNPSLHRTPAGLSAFRQPWPWWKRILIATYDSIGEDRVLAVAAGVVFFALLAVFPAVTAFVSLYGLFAKPTTVSDHLSLLSNVMPGGGLDIIRDQVIRIVTKSDGRLSIGFLVGTAVALWSANAGVKAMMDALNVAGHRHETRGFFRLNAVSLVFTLGALVFLLLAIGAVVAFPLVMSAFGLASVTSVLTWLLRWPVLLLLVLFGLAVLYRFGPSRQAPRWRWVTPGSLLAAFLWLTGSAALSFYLSNFADYNATYGSLGAAIGLMMWMWLSAISVLIGAELDAEIEKAQSTPVG